MMNKMRRKLFGMRISTSKQNFGSKLDHRLSLLMKRGQNLVALMHCLVQCKHLFTFFCRFSSVFSCYNLYKNRLKFLNLLSQSKLRDFKT